MKDDIDRKLKDAFILGFAGWYLRLKYWKKRVEEYEEGRAWRYWKAGGKRRGKKFYWWEDNEK